MSRSRGYSWYIVQLIIIIKLNLAEVMKYVLYAKLSYRRLINTSADVCIIMNDFIIITFIIIQLIFITPRVANDLLKMVLLKKKQYKYYNPYKSIILKLD